MEKKYLWRWIGATVVIVALTTVGYLFGKEIIAFVSNTERMRAWIDSKGVWSRVAFVGMICFQVIVAIIPGEPFELAAGYAFGTLEGTLLCLGGILIGSIIIFCAVRKWGECVARVFFSEDKIRSLDHLRQNKRVLLLWAILMILPGTPKDLLTYYAGLTDIGLGWWIVIVAIGRIPSVVTSTLAADAVSGEKWGLAATVLIITALLCLTGLYVYNQINGKNKGKE